MVDLMSGMFRGVCVDNRDPKNLGRIRVQVPQILGMTASGWAFPAWSFSEMTIWPEDRLPQAGQGVWVMFDSTSPDKMIWLAAFGPLPLINQPGLVDQPDYQSTLTMTMDNTPVWNTNTTFSGALTSDIGGVPNPNPKVLLTGRNSGGDWSDLGEATPNPTTGVWSIVRLIQMTGQVEYRAVFPGVGVYSTASSDTIFVNTAAISFPTTLTLAMTDPSPALNKTVTFTGRLLTGGSPPAGYGVPQPNAQVSLMARAGGVGAWTTVATSAIAADPTTGDYSVNYTIAIPGSVQYQASFAQMGVFGASVSTPITISTSVATTVSTPVIPAQTYGAGFNVSGTVKVTSTQASVTAGTVQLWWRHTAGGNTAWQNSGVSQTITAGTYSLTHGNLAVLGGTEWQVQYLGTSSFNAANSTAVPVTVSLPAMTALVEGTMAHTTASFTWPAVAGATGYEVQQKAGTGAWGTAVANTTRSYSATGLAADTTYTWQVRAKAVNNAGTTIYTGYTTISGKTGHPKVTILAGTSGWFSVDTNTFRCHRNDSTAWGDSGDYEMRQGYFSSLYGGAGYIGVAVYSGATIKAAVVTACGTDGSLKQSNGTCYACQITLYRTTTGTDTGADAKFYTTLSTGSGARPNLDGTAVVIDASDYSTSKTYNIGTAHGQRLGDAGANSVAIYTSADNQYLGLNGSGTDGGKLEMRWTWPAITKTELVAAAWV